MAYKNKKKVLKARYKMAEAVVRALEESGRKARKQLVKDAETARQGSAKSDKEMTGSENARQRLAKLDTETGTRAAPHILNYHRGKARSYSGRSPDRNTDAAADAARTMGVIGGQESDAGDPRNAGKDHSVPKRKDPKLMRRMLQSKKEKR